MFRLVFFFAAVLFLGSCSDPKKIDYERRIDAVKTAFDQKKLDSLQPYLANGYSIKGLPEGMESMVLPIILEKLPKITRYKITNTIHEKLGTRLDVTFYGVTNDSTKSNFLIAADGKFLELNILEDAKISTSVSK